MAGELAQRDYEAAELLGPLADEICDRLREAPDWAARFAVLDQILAARFAAAPDRARASGTLRQAWNRLLASGGRMPIGELAADVGWSDRQLRAVLAAETGLTPKAAARVIRFDRARRLLRARAAAGRPPRLADLAAECGYHDQPHLAREFRELVGCPPGEWLAQECRIVQAVPGEPLPDLAA